MAADHSTRARTKPNNPRKDFPLYLRRNRQREKDVRGKTHFFGGWEDPDAAIDEWLRVKNDLIARRKPRAKLADGPRCFQCHSNS